jgi:hypothetical protein
MWIRARQFDVSNSELLEELAENPFDLHYRNDLLRAVIRYHAEQVAEMMNIPSTYLPSVTKSEIISIAKGKLPVTRQEFSVAYEEMADFLRTNFRPFYFDIDAILSKLKQMQRKKLKGHVLWTVKGFKVVLDD